MLIWFIFIHPFIRRNRDIVIYFDMTHSWLNRIASWVILSKIEPEADEVVVADTETISDDKCQNNLKDWLYE